MLMNARRGNTTVMEMPTALILMVHLHVIAAVDTVGVDRRVQVRDNDVAK